MKLNTLALAALLGLSGASPTALAVAAPAPTASPQLPPAGDVAALHAFVEALAYDQDEARALKGFDALAAAGEAYAPGLAQLYLNPQGDVRCRWVAGQALGRMRSPQAQAAIQRGLKDPLPLARIAAVEALPNQRPAGARELLEAALNDPAAMVRASAADSLGRLGDTRASASLITAWADPQNVHKGKSLFVRVNILLGLGALRARDGVPVMLEGLSDSNPDVAAAAHDALLAVSRLPAAPPGTSPEAERWRAFFGL